MPHSTTTASTARRPSLSRSSSLKPYRDGNGDARLPDALEKFPDMDTQTNGRSSSPRKENGSAHEYSTSTLAAERWPPKRENGGRAVRWGASDPSGFSKSHGRQKSLGEAIRTIRTRRPSVSQSAHEIADALKAPVSPALIVRDPASGDLFVRPRATAC